MTRKTSGSPSQRLRISACRQGVTNHLKHIWSLGKPQFVKGTIVIACQKLAEVGLRVCSGETTTESPLVSCKAYCRSRSAGLRVSNPSSHSRAPARGSVQVS